MVTDMKKIILTTMILLSMTSSFAETQEPGVRSDNGVGQGGTPCPAGDDSARSTSSQDGISGIDPAPPTTEGATIDN